MARHAVRSTVAAVLLCVSAVASALELDGPPEPFAEVAASSASEIRIAFSPDGQWALWGVIPVGEAPDGWQIVASRRGDDGQWSTPAPVSFDTPANEFDPAFAPDGRQVYFFSNRPGGLGGDDLYVVDFDPDSGEFGAPDNLGPVVNTAADEWAPTPRADGALLFSSGGHGGAGGQDLFLARPGADGFATVEPLPGTVNTGEDEFDATWLPDGTLVFTRQAKGEDGCRLWSARRDGERWLEPAPLIDAPGWRLGPATDPQAPGWLYFSGPGATPAQHLDVLRVRYRD